MQTPTHEMPLKEVKMLPVELNVNGNVVPYVVLYTYVPNIDSFVVVRINQNDLKV